MHNTVWITLYVLLASLASEQKFSNDLSSFPVILWWTSRLFPHWNTDVAVIARENGKCISTKSREYFTNGSVDSILFYGTDLELEDLPLPRFPRHEWALLHEESPMNNYVLSHKIFIELFNLTATFSRHSDFPLTTLFLPSLEYLISRKPVDIRIKNELRTGEEKLAPILYVQSHCNVPSDRDRYVEELSKYIPIDSYGQCLHNRDLPEEFNSTEHYDSEPFLQFIARYKFHFAFENAICEDYITEKLFRALHVGSVPVYRGSPTVHDFLPSTSAIVVDDFTSPKQLANFILSLDADDEKYGSFLSFKKTDSLSNDLLREALLKRPWGVHHPDLPDFIHGFESFVCDDLLEKKRALELGGEIPIKIASDRHMGCPEPRISVGRFQDIQYNDEELETSPKRNVYASSQWQSRDNAIIVWKRGTEICRNG